MKYKKIYIEITNICNMNCSFCPPHKRQNKYMSFDEFKIVLEKIRSYTKFIYLHVKGEPMLHPEFDKFVEYAHEQGFFVNITTNGTLLEKHLNTTKFIRQINISLHATNNLEIIKTAKKIKDCYVNFRVWNFINSRNGELDSANNFPALRNGEHDSANNFPALRNGEHDLDDNFPDLRNGEHCSPHKNATIDILNTEFDIDIYQKLHWMMQQKNHTSLSSETNFTLKDNFFISIQNEFKWPEIKDKSSNITTGYCHALKDHIAILVDGTVVPCCLDNNGDINLGNIYKESLEDIINSERALRIIQGFQNRTCVEELCKNCEYKNRF